MKQAVAALATTAALLGTPLHIPQSGSSGSFHSLSTESSTTNEPIQTGMRRAATLPYLGTSAERVSHLDYFGEPAVGLSDQDDGWGHYLDSEQLYAFDSSCGTSQTLPDIDACYAKLRRTQASKLGSPAATNSKTKSLPNLGVFASQSGDREDIIVGRYVASSPLENKNYFLRMSKLIDMIPEKSDFAGQESSNSVGKEDAAPLVPTRPYGLRTSRARLSASDDSEIDESEETAA